MDPFINPEASIEDCIGWLQEEALFEAVEEYENEAEP